MLINGYQPVPCDKDNFDEVFMDCLVDAMADLRPAPDCVNIPTHLNLRYSPKGGMGLTIGPFWIIIVSSSPLEKEEVVRTIREVYEFLFSFINDNLKIGDISETVIVPEKEYGLDIEIRQIQ